MCLTKRVPVVNPLWHLVYTLLCLPCQRLLFYDSFPMAYDDVRRPEISHAKEVEERSFALASSWEHQKGVDQADCSLRAFFVLKGHNSRWEADNCRTILGI